MIERIIEYSIRNRFVVLILAAGLAVLEHLSPCSTRADGCAFPT